MLSRPSLFGFFPDYCYFCMIKTASGRVIIIKPKIKTMANKREFKKYVDAIGASVIDEMIAAYYNVEKADKDKIAEAMQKVLCAIGRAKNNSNVTFDRGEKAFGDKKEYVTAKKNFYKSLFDKIFTEFDEETGAALKEFNAAIPEEVKMMNKESVNA